MWTLLIIGIFSGAVQGPTMQMDADTLKTLVELSGDITISQSGYSTEEACKVQIQAAQGRHSFSMNGMKVTMKSVECRNVEERATEGKGPRS